ncbi:hypothetical protein MYVALT_G_00630 [Candidatus Vallotia tarda]|uniref:Uncharacterized protein n=1 Tax=Candidatus Vallotiella hemipterorum TaxID=1177213 RepID=A0A916NKQ4_9BURK|nr:hypothetical protein MYVALT_G_00630 [Candidatus Vallotia tarda]
MVLVELGNAASIGNSHALLFLQERNKDMFSHANRLKREPVKILNIFLA